MKKNLLLLLLTSFIGITTFAQTDYNPIVQNINFDHPPSINGFTCDTTTTVVFTQGLTTAADATQWQTSPLIVTICIGGFDWDGTAAASVVSGSYASNFTWAFDSFAPSCLVGTQNQSLPGIGTDTLNPNPLSSGDIILGLKVPESSPSGSVLSVNVNLQVPGYMAQSNVQSDDQVAIQTQVYCPLTLSGNLFFDSTLNDGEVNGARIQTADDSALCVSLVNANGLVVANTSINPEGFYEFLDVAPNAAYTAHLSMTCGIIGNAPSAQTLPPIWVFVNEDCCDGLGNDGVADGIIPIVMVNESQENANFGIWRPTITSPLPVTYKNFNIVDHNCTSLISWVTVQEQSTSHVEIERKKNVTASFEKITTIATPGNSTFEKVYSYTDANIEEQDDAYIYRLKFFNIDSTFIYSEQIAIQFNCNTDKGKVTQLYPNPTDKALTFTYKTELNDVQLFIDILDLNGRKLMSQTQIINGGEASIDINIDRLPVGQYIIRYYNKEDSERGTIRFSKK